MVRGDASSILDVVSVAAHRGRLVAHGMNGGRAARRTGPGGIRALRGVMEVGEAAVRHARAHAGMAVHRHWGRQGVPNRPQVPAAHARRDRLAHLTHPRLSHWAGGAAIMGLRSSRLARPEHALAPRARGGSGAVATEAMRREVARGATEALRHEIRHPDHASRGRGVSRQMMGPAAMQPDMMHQTDLMHQKDPKGPLPTHLRNEVRHALEAMRGDSRDGMRRLFADESRRPPAGVTGFDHRLAPIWAGRKPAF